METHCEQCFYAAAALNAFGYVEYYYRMQEKLLS